MNKPITLFCALMLFFLSKSYSQFSIDNIDEIDNIKNNTTYIIMDDLESDVSKEYMQIYKENWTFSKIEFITNSEMKNHIEPNNFFFSIGGYETSVSTSTGGWSNTHIYLELWTFTEKFLKNKKEKTLKLKDKKVISRIELFTDFYALMSPSLISKKDYNAGGHIRNWGKGILKNYIQYLMVSLEKNEKKGMFYLEPKSSELEHLKTSTLYVPDYTLIKFNKFTGDESEKHDAKDLFEDYNYKYEIITTEELNDKILNSSEPFYYLIYVKSSTDKYISVINSKTGEMIYSSYSPASYNIKSKDLKELIKTIK